MSLKILCYFLFCINLLAFGAESKSFDADLVLIKRFQFRMILEHMVNGWTENFELIDVNTKFRGELAEQPPMLVDLHGDSSYMKATYLDRSTGKSLAVPWDMVIALEIQVKANKNPFSCPLQGLDLATFPAVQNFPISNLEALTIDLEEFYCPTAIHFSQWNQYPSWAQANTLESFEIQRDFMPQFDFCDLSPFTNLKQLVIPADINTRLLDFPHLERVTMTNPLFGFAHNLLKLDGLKQFQSIDCYYRSQYENLHAERAFFTDATLPRKEMTISSLKYNKTNNPFVALVQKALEVFPQSFPENGEVLLFENDFPEYTEGSDFNDTLLHGQIKNGKLVGIWTAKFNFQEEIKDSELFYFDFDRRAPKTKKNGTWKYFYPNGQLAIEGQFKKNLKQEEWKFYRNDGVLRTQRRFENDTLRWTSTEVIMDGNACESRAYYFSESQCVQSYQVGDNKLFVGFLDLNTFNKPKILINLNGWSVWDPEVGIYHTYFKGTEKFAEFTEKYLCTYLYPEYAGKDFPFQLTP